MSFLAFRSEASKGRNNFRCRQSLNPIKQLIKHRYVYMFRFEPINARLKGIDRHAIFDRLLSTENHRSTGVKEYHRSTTVDKTVDRLLYCKQKSNLTYIYDLPVGYLCRIHMHKHHNYCWAFRSLSFPSFRAGFIATELPLLLLNFNSCRLWSKLLRHSTPGLPDTTQRLRARSRWVAS